MTEDIDIARWSDEAVAEAFRAEIRARFEAHNAAFRAHDAAELEKVLCAHPEQREQPGFEVRDSGAWQVYQASEIRIDRNAVTIVLPGWYAVGIDLVYLFDNTTVAWARPSIGATLVDGEARPTIELLLVATWTDEQDAKWKQDGNDRKRVLVELYEEDVRWLDTVIATQVPGGRTGDERQAIREQLELALVPLP